MDSQSSPGDPNWNMKPVVPVQVKAGRSLANLLDCMGRTGFQGRTLVGCIDIWERMARDPHCTILLGYAGSLSVAGQYEIINWFLEHSLVDVLVSTGANISEDIVDVLGFPYRQLEGQFVDNELFARGLNRYYDIAGHEDDYMRMTELIAEYYQSLGKNHSFETSADLLHEFGRWLSARGVHRSIVATAFRLGVPVYCPALQDSPYGDAALLARSRGHLVSIDAFRDYESFMRLSTQLDASGVVYIGGGVPKDMVQLLAVTPGLLFPHRKIPGRQDGLRRHDENSDYHPHRYAVQITTDSPQWGGLSGCTLEEAVSWGKVNPEMHSQCFCDATIALPLVAHGLAERLSGFERKRRMIWTPGSTSSAS